ncbi:MAG: hypothetical protein N2255_04700 [Kiritimatiellae bacterium]|nr:hypothetical protein [Kiritimatiellia bacterium]
MAQTPSADEAEETQSRFRLAVFDVDVTPPIGCRMAYDPVTNWWDLTLKARGIVILDACQPVVVCAVDWIGIGNEGHDEFRAVLARAACTTPGRVAVHTLHQHDAPACDFTAEKILCEHGLDPGDYRGDFAREVLRRLEKAVRQAVSGAQPVTHVGLGRATVEKVASNRRILGPDGKVRATRYTACKDAALRAEPEGTIDPELSMISFWSGDRPLAVLTYYATHPQSYYRTGIPNPDFPGVARFFRQLAVPAALHVHFNGAGGNVGAGKYNDGSPENRLVLAQRLAEGMRRAWEATVRQPVDASMVGWSVESVTLPVASHLSEAALLAELRNANPAHFLSGAAARLAWLRRCKSGHKIDVTCLRVGDAYVLHMPGELFVEYQLAAKAMRPDRFVAMAAYGDYGPGYIGTEVAYSQGGYETGPTSSYVSPEVEKVLTTAMKRLLQPSPQHK